MLTSKSKRRGPGKGPFSVFGLLIRDCNEQQQCQAKKNQSYFHCLPPFGHFEPVDPKRSMALGLMTRRDRGGAERVRNEHEHTFDYANSIGGHN